MLGLDGSRHVFRPVFHKELENDTVRLFERHKLEENDSRKNAGIPELL